MILHTWRPLGLYTFLLFHLFFLHFISFDVVFVVGVFLFSAQKMVLWRKPGIFFFIFNMLGMYFWWRGMNWQKISPREMWKIKCHFRSFHLSCPYFFFHLKDSIEIHSILCRHLTVYHCSLLFAFSIEISSQILFRSEF